MSERAHESHRQTRERSFSSCGEGRDQGTGNRSFLCDGLKRVARGLVKPSLIFPQLLDAHVNRIKKLEKELAELEDVRERVTAVETELELCRDEKSKLETILRENLDLISSLEDKLQASMNREQEKDGEIATLQQGVVPIPSTLRTETDVNLNFVFQT